MRNQENTGRRSVIERSDLVRSMLLGTNGAKIKRMLAIQKSGAKKSTTSVWPNVIAAESAESDPQAYEACDMIAIKSRKKLCRKDATGLISLALVINSSLPVCQFVVSMRRCVFLKDRLVISPKNGCALFDAFSKRTDPPNLFESSVNFSKSVWELVVFQWARERERKCVRNREAIKECSPIRHTLWISKLENTSASVANSLDRLQLYYVLR